MRQCENCKAVVPEGKGGICNGKFHCCVHCAFHPLGCRCQFGEFGVEETQQWFGDEDDDYDPDEENRNDYSAKVDDEILRRVDP